MHCATLFEPVLTVSPPIQEQLSQLNHRLEAVLAEKETAEAELVELRARLEGEGERLGREKEALVQQVR